MLARSDEDDSFHFSIKVGMEQIVQELDIVVQKRCDAVMTMN